MFWQLVSKTATEPWANVTRDKKNLKLADTCYTCVFPAAVFFCLRHSCYHVLHNTTRLHRPTDWHSEVLSSIPKSLDWTTGTEDRIRTFRHFWAFTVRSTHHTTARYSISVNKLLGWPRDSHSLCTLQGFVAAFKTNRSWTLTLSPLWLSISPDVTSWLSLFAILLTRLETS